MDFFWLYGQKVIDSVINGVNHKMLSVSSLCLPRIYTEMKKVGIKAPKWRFDSRSNQGKKCGDFKLNIWQSGSFSENVATGSLQVERDRGVWVLCLYGYGQSFIKMTRGDKRVKMPKTLKAKIKMLCCRLELDMMEILFLYSKNRWVAYGVSVQIDMEKRWRSHWSKVVNAMISLVERPKRKEGRGKSCFIARENLPFS